jgi:hypothetical protein
VVKIIVDNDKFTDVVHVWIRAQLGFTRLKRESLFP